MAESAMTKLRKHEFIPFLDVSGTSNSDSWSPSWKRIDLSTIFSLNPNPQTETQDYISYETSVEEITQYQPELPQEIALYEGNAIYDYMFSLFFDLPVGSEIQIPFLMCFGGSEKKAWQVRKTTVVLGELNTVDGKLSFTLRMGGDIERGTYTILAGVPTFASDTAA